MIHEPPARFLHSIAHFIISLQPFPRPIHRNISSSLSSPLPLAPPSFLVLDSFRAPLLPLPSPTPSSSCPPTPLVPYHLLPLANHIPLYHSPTFPTTHYPHTPTTLIPYHPHPISTTKSAPHSLSCLPMQCLPFSSTLSHHCQKLQLSSFFRVHRPRSIQHILQHLYRFLLTADLEGNSHLC